MRLRAVRFLLPRRLVQSAVALAFVLAPPAIVSGDLASSLWLGVLPLSDPFATLQAWLAGATLAPTTWIGALLVAGFFAVFGGRVFCAWICPINLVTDLAGWLRRLLGLRDVPAIGVDRRLRSVIATAVFAGAALGVLPLWESVNPITLLQRSLIYGTAAGLWAAAAVFASDLLVRRGWCGHLCPVGAFYGWLGQRRVLTVAVVRRAACNGCGNCYKVCPEPHVIAPALRGAPDAPPAAIEHRDCTSCGRCIEMCATDVFAVRWRPSERAIAAETPATK